MQKQELDERRQQMDIDQMNSDTLMEQQRQDAFRNRSQGIKYPY